MDSFEPLMSPFLSIPGKTSNLHSQAATKFQIVDENASCTTFMHICSGGTTIDLMTLPVKVHSSKHFPDT